LNADLTISVETHLYDWVEVVAQRSLVLEFRPLNSEYGRGSPWLGYDSRDKVSLWHFSLFSADYFADLHGNTLLLDDFSKLGLEELRK
jgi:hypothetical protein